MRDRTKSFKELNRKQKMQYIWDYYKLPIVIALILLYIITYFFYRQVTQKKNVLYTACINVEIGDDLRKVLETDYLASQNLSDKKYQIYSYQNLYLSSTGGDTAQIAAASQVKIMASIQSKELDVIFATKEVYEAFADEGYLLDISDWKESSSFLYNTDSLEISKTAAFEKAGFTEPVYLGVIKNSPRIKQIQSYINYLIK